ncbi:host cell division inhibitor Icd-like protein [Salmonella enterica subsp. salamae]|nr:host cell division inhibitor Icd-like protein [Salmonella enterica]ECF5834973.1 host cell division inhibitor Icd-like protein [Salmonella enterica subsp. salamae]ECO2987574.1 host cell division inhibitor Icd-like protein [Salmonella enterica subsp. enterica serovar Salford]ECF5995977.1 host cell division inhibitor Icd-like protein [Salmonella enterica subsp. salamae]ECG1598454.1 host cell division inhibitor Icd-like protein [Salmonella enterica subsp. salamae]
MMVCYQHSFPISNRENTVCTPYAPKEKGNAANVAFGNQIDHWSGLSFDFLRCRRLISPFAAVTKNPAVLSPSSLRDSISSITSWGIRTVVICDFAFFAPVAITDTPLNWCMSVYAKKILKKGLRCISLWSSVCCKGEIHLEQCEAQRGRQSGWASNHNVTEAYIMACSHDTQTRPEFTYLFLGTPSDKPNTTPVVLRVEANTEKQARSHFLNWNLVFAAQIRTKAPCRLQLMDGGDRFSWIFEQLPDVCTSGVQEVAYV